VATLLHRSVVVSFGVCPPIACVARLNAKNLPNAVLAGLCNGCPAQVFVALS
jgi:hypothetical protein